MDDPDGDFVISVDGEDIRCHKKLLVQQSDYFRALFDSQMSECESNRVALTDISLEIMTTIIECIHTGELKIHEDTVTELAQAAVRFQVPAAIRSCESYLLSSLDDTNCFSCWQLAKSLCFDGLYNLAKRHLLYYFTAVVNQPEYLTLDPDPLVEYLSDKHLNCQGELNVLKAIDTWVSHDSGDRLKHLDKLLTCFHAEDLLPSEWAEVMEHPLLSSTGSAPNWIRENGGLRKFSVPRHTRCQFDESSCTLSKEEEKVGRKPKRQYRQLPVMFLRIAGFEMHLRIGEMCKFDAEKEVFTPLIDPKQIIGHSNVNKGFRVTTIGKDIYITGGQTDFGRNSTFCLDVWKYDGFEDSWSVVTRLRSPRRHHGVCASNSSVYLLGGFGSFRQKLQTFDEYDTVNDEWKSLPDFPDDATFSQILYCNKKIYLYGSGCMHYYDTKTWVWATAELDYMINILCPVVFGNCYTYLFPKVESFDRAYCPIWFARHDYENNKLEHFQFPSSRKLSAVVIVNDTVFALSDTDFMCWSVYADCEVQKLGSGGSSLSSSTLVALVKYPTYTLTGKG